MDGLWWKTLLKWIIWGYHYFWKHPYSYIGWELTHIQGSGVEKYDDRWHYRLIAVIVDSWSMLVPQPSWLVELVKKSWFPPRLTKNHKRSLMITNVAAVMEASWHGAEHWVFGQPWCFSSYLPFSQLLGSGKLYVLSSRQSEGSGGIQNEVIMLPVFPIMALSGPLFTEMNDGEARGEGCCADRWGCVLCRHLWFHSEMSTICKQFVSQQSLKAGSTCICVCLYIFLWIPSLLLYLLLSAGVTWTILLRVWVFGCFLVCYRLWVSWRTFDWQFVSSQTTMNIQRFVEQYFQRTSLVSFRFFGAFIEAWLGGSIAFLVVFGGLWVGSVLSKVHEKLILWWP